MEKIDYTVDTADQEEQKEVFNMFRADMNNLAICTATGLAYSKALAYRIAFEKGVLKNDIRK